MSGPESMEMIRNTLQVSHAALERPGQLEQFVARLVHAKRDGLLAPTLGIGTIARCVMASLDVCRMCAVL